MLRLIEVVVLRILSALGLPARLAASLYLTLVLAGCQGVAPSGNSGSGQHGTLAATPASLSFGNVTVGKTASLAGSLNAGGSAVIVSSASSSSSEFTVSGISFPATLAAGQRLSFRVAFTPQASGSAAATLTFTSDAVDPSSLQSVDGTGAPVPQHAVDLSWNASQSSDVVGYNVFRGNNMEGPYSRINVALEASLSYTDSGVTGGKKYYYVVTAMDSNSIESGYSNEASAVIPVP